ncbi:vacuolar zinc transporter Zrc1p [Monosporozyma servazzii]
MKGGKQIRIVSLLVLDTIFFFLEIIIGYISHSLALIADSFHMLNDIFSLLVALWAVKVAKERDPDAKYTYGWKRAEILGALVNAVFLIALCFSIFIEALQRLLQPQEINNPQLVMYIGITGLISNCVGLLLFNEHDHDHSHMDSNDLFSHSHYDDLESTAVDDTEDDSHSHSHSISEDTFAITDRTVQLLTSESTPLLLATPPPPHKAKKPKSLNMHGVFLHVLGDALGNIGVIVAALFIWKTDYSWRFYSDPVVSLLITAIIFASALPLSRKASRILLQATPKTISAEIIRQRIQQVPGVVEVHDFHIWNLTESITIASIHVKIDIPTKKYIDTAKSIRNIFHQFGIHSATVQPEFVSGNIDENERRRFSFIAGDVNGSNLSVHSPSTEAAAAAYGSTTVDHCVIDNAVNCSQEHCMDR